MLAVPGKRRNKGKYAVYYLYLFLCMFPFLFGNPFVETDMQPYALLVAVLISFTHFSKIIGCEKFNLYFYVSFFLFVCSLLVFILSGLTISSFRAFYNYCALFFIPCALIVVFTELDTFPERFFKFCIVVWFGVSLIQFFIDRGFATFLIGTVRGNDINRGVVGLASEPSYLGISCFYFLLISKFFTKKKFLYQFLILIMGTVFAQSTLGIIFIASYWLFYLLDNVRGRMGVSLTIVSFVLVAGFVYLLENRFAGTRMESLLSTFSDEGFSGIEEDESAMVRYNSILDAISGAFDDFLIPMGFERRIGSAYGGLLCELGFLSLPFLFVASRSVALSFSRKAVRFLFFFVFSVLMFNNTQIGNPVLLLVITANTFFVNLKQREVRLV